MILFVLPGIAFLGLGLIILLKGTFVAKKESFRRAVSYYGFATAFFITSKIVEVNWTFIVMLIANIMVVEFYVYGVDQMLDEYLQGRPKHPKYKFQDGNVYVIMNSTIDEVEEIVGDDENHMSKQLSLGRVLVECDEGYAIDKKYMYSKFAETVGRQKTLGVAYMIIGSFYILLSMNFEAFRNLIVN